MNQHNFGIVGDQACLLCQHNQETTQHLFFDCPYSKECLQGVQSWLGWRSKETELEKITKWVLKAKMGAFRRSLLCSVISALVYHIWKARNGMLWDKKTGLPKHIVQQVNQVVKLRLSLVKPKKVSVQEQEWMEPICTK